MSSRGTSPTTHDRNSSTAAKQIVGKIHIPLLLSPTEKFEKFNSCNPKSSDTIQATLQVDEIAESSIMLSKYTYEERSPDIFAVNYDDDDDDDELMDKQNNAEGLLLIENERTNSHGCLTKTNHSTDLLQSTGSCDKNEINLPNDINKMLAANCQREAEILKRIRKSLSGILPPPSVTLPQINLIDQVLLHKDDIINFMNKSFSSFNGNISSDKQFNESKQSEQIITLLKPSHSLQETQTADWPDASNIRQHGLCYNICKASETIEYLNLSVIERFIGNETSSSYQQSPSSTKKNSSRLKLLCKSPGNRLSHLAKRRAIFSSLHLASNQQKSTMLIGPQVLIDKKKIKNRRKGATPKRLESPAKRGRNTSTSSARKRLFRSDICSGPSRESSKRALFQSPPQTSGKQQKQSDQQQSTTVSNKMNKSTKRFLLFTPTKRNKEYNEKFKSNNSYSSSLNCTSFESLLKRKRNDVDDPDNELNLHNHKIFKANTNASLTPRALQIKSQSFCEGSVYTKLMQHQAIDNHSNSLLIENQLNVPQHILNTSSAKSGNKLPRTYTDYQPPHNSLTDNQKKKLLWAISQALQERKINAKHEQFKQYASTLAKVVKRIFQEYYQKTSTSNSETMLRLSKRYVYYVISGSTVDEIYLLAKQHIEESKRQSTNRTIACITPGLLDCLQQQQQYQTLTTALSNSSVNCHHNEPNSHNKEQGESKWGLPSFDTPEECFSTMKQKISGTCDCKRDVNQSITENDFVEQRIQTTVKAASTNSTSKTTVPHVSLKNSSSKCNLDGLVLSENANHGLRRSLSAQKNFTGKDQKNLSPYASNHPTSAIKAQTQSIGNDLRSNINIFKTVKRHIIFDS